MAVLSKETLSQPGVALYSWLVRNLLPKLGEKWTFAALTSLYHDAFVFIPVNALLFYIDGKPWNPVEQYRIQPGKRPPPELVKEALRDLTISHLLVNPLLAGLVLYPVFKNRMVSLGDSLNNIPSWKEFLIHFAAFMAIEDTVFYFSHRLLHTKMFYAKIHKQHHKFKQNVGIASEWANPVESLLGNTLPTLLGPYLLKTHPFTMFSWLAYRVLETINAHCGYNIPYIPFNWWPLGGADRHEFHHSNNLGMFGSQTRFWDWFLGTDKVYWESRKRKQEGKAEGDLVASED